jgi:hypothetical protein
MKLVSLVFILSFVTSLVCGQVITSSVSGRGDGKTPEVAQSEARFNQLTSEVGYHFKKGLFHLQDNRRSDASKEFDLTVEVFLLSNVDVQSNQRLRECYSQLTETIYRMEFPVSSQPPNIRSLSVTCGWNIDNDLADKIAKIVQISTSNTNQGFVEQRFEGSKFISLEDGYSMRRDVTLGRRLVQSNRVNSCQNSDSPIIQGLRLDTPISLIKRDSKLEFSRAKKLSINTANDGYLFTSPNTNVKDLSLVFYKDSLLIISVSYSSGILWSSLEEFRQKIVDTLGVSGTWETTPMKNGTRTLLECRDFWVILNKIGEEYSLYSSSKIVETRRRKDTTEASKERAKTQQRKKEVFKP